MVQIVFIDSKGRAVTHVVHLKATADEVMWIDQNNAGPWWITFDKPNNPYFPDPQYKPGSPFTGAPFQVPQNGNKKSGLATVLGTYKYHVRRDSGGQPGQITNDPDIEIE